MLIPGMNSKLTVHIEGASSGKTLLPWTSIVRRGRLSTEAQFFGLFGFDETDLASCPPETLENAREFIEYALRFATAFEYIPKNSEEAEPFFEKKLAAFQERLRDHGGNLPPFHVGLGIVIGNYILFANSGDISILSITEQMINNLSELSGGESFHFGTFRSGTLVPHSYLLFIPKRLGTILKSEELKLLARSRSSEAKLPPMKHLIETRTGQSLALRAVLLEARSAVNRPTESTESSIAQLLKTEATTEELLAPPLLRPFIKNLTSTARKAYSAYKNLLATYSEKIATAPTNETTSRPRVKQKIRAAVPPPPDPASMPISAQKTISSYFMHALIWSKKGAHTRLQTLQNKFSKFKNPSTYTKNAQGWLRTCGEAMIRAFNALPRKNKLLLLLIVLFIFVSAQGVFLARNRALTQKAEFALTNELSTIQGLINNTNASLIYQDETRGRQQLDAVQARIAAFPEFHARVISKFGISRFRASNYTARETLQKLALSIAPLEKKLRHVITIETPTPVSSDMVKTLALTGETTTALFRKRLYTLNPESNQILRHEPKPDGFDAGSLWLKDGTDIKNAITLAIDGSLYVGTADGKIIRLLKGAKTAFAIKPIDPPLTAIKKLWTTEDSDYLYALDPTQKRLLTFAKNNGLLKAQYVSPSFTDLQDFSIDERAKLGYLLNGANVVSIPLSH